MYVTKDNKIPLDSSTWAKGKAERLIKRGIIEKVEDEPKKKEVKSDDIQTKEEKSVKQTKSDK